MSRENRNYAIAETVMQLFDSGNRDPNVAEIAKEYFGDKVVVGREELRIIRRALGPVRKLLDQEFDQVVYLVNAAYYRRPRLDRFGASRQIPASSADARKCLPLGQGVKAEGICLVTDGDDLIWVESLKQDGAVASGHLKKVDGNHGRGLQKGILSQPIARALRQQVKADALPGEPSWQEALKALEAPAE